MTHTPQTNRIACVYVPDFLLQLSLHNLPQDFRAPVALVDRSDSRAIVMAVDERAAAKGIYPGLSYANAIGLCPQLHAACPHSGQINQIHRRIITQLGLFSPAVEPVAELFGAYYLDVSGMTRLEPDLCAWGQRLQDALLKEQHLQTAIVIGFTRFGTRTSAALAKGVTLFSTVEIEHNAACSTPLKKLDLTARPLRELEKLNILTVGDLMALPDWEVRSRFAEPMFDLVRKAKERDGQVRGIKFPEPYAARAEFEHTENDAERLVNVIVKLSAPLLERMKTELQGQGVSAICIRLARDYGGTFDEKIQAAKPTLAMPTLTDLVRLRCHTIKLDEGITGLTVHLIPGALPDPQLNLHPALVKSDESILKANRAIARVLAEFGTGRVLKAKCHKAHLPHDAFEWEDFDQLQASTPGQQVHTSMMRRFLDQPRRVPTPEQTAAQRILGPYTTSGFWWRTNSVQRNDYFVETGSGDAQWIFYDKNSRAWYAQGFIQ